MKDEWLFPNAVVPVDTQTTLALLVEIKRLIDVQNMASKSTYKAALAQPAQRTWVRLTDEEMKELWEVSRAALPRYATYASLVEAKLKEKNT